MNIRNIIRTYLKTMVQNHRGHETTMIKKRAYFVYEYILRNTSMIPNDRTFMQRIEWIINRRDTYPKCQNENCNNLLNEKRHFHRGHYVKFCCVKCVESDKNRILKMQETKLRRYGDPYYRNPDKAKLTNLERYGRISFVGTEEYKRKRTETCLKKYGTDCSQKNENVKKKSKETRINRYGKYESDETTLKRKTTNIKKYGVENVFFSDYWQNKMKLSVEKKYGVQNVFQNEDIKKQIRDTMNRIYGCDNPSQSVEITRKKRKKYYFDSIYFDSSWEVSYYIWLKDNKVNFTYHPSIKFEYMIDSVKHYYYPDFIVNGEIVEIKGDYMFDKEGNPFNVHTKRFWWQKYECMKSNNVRIMKYSDVRQFIEYTLNKYGRKFFKQIKNNMV